MKSLRLIFVKICWSGNIKKTETLSHCDAKNNNVCAYVCQRTEDIRYILYIIYANHNNA